jgi:hypothetical protein
MPSLPPIELSRVQPDHNQIAQKLVAILSTKDSWKDILTTATGQHIIEMIAAVGAFSQYNIESTLQELFLDTAKLDSSIYAITRMLGVRIGRKSPATCRVTLNRPTALVYYTIPAYSKFVTPKGFLFNRTDLAFPIGVTTIEADLYEGEVRQKTLVGGIDDSGLTSGPKNTDFQTYISAEGGFTVADRDVLVTVDNVNIPVVTEGLWHYKNSVPAVQDATTSDGYLQLIFGNRAFGTKPATGSSIKITYAVTKGEEGNDADFAGTAITYDADPNVVTGTAKVTSDGNLYGGAQELGADSYRELSPLLYASGDRAVTQTDYEALVRTYSSRIKDAKCLGQRDLAPYDVKYMNLVQVTVVADPVFNNSDYIGLFAFLRKKAMYSTVFFRKDAIPVTVNVEADVFCRNTVDLTAAQNAITQNLNDFLRARPNILGFDVFRSDIYETIENSIEGIDYIVLKNPITDTYVNVRGPSSMTITPNGAGVLPAGTYTYYLGVVTATGENIPVRMTGTLASTGGFQLIWAPVANAISYKLYGRTVSGVGLLATIPSNIVLYNDNGTAVPDTLTKPPIVDGSGSNISYPVLGTLTLRMGYTDRNLEPPRLINS